MKKSIDIDKEMRRIQIARRAHGKMIKYILHEHYDTYWGEYDEEIKQNIDAIDDLQFADTDPNDIYEDGIYIDGYILYSWDIVWTLSGKGMLKNKMKFEDALRHDHIEGHEQVRNKIKQMNNDIRKCTPYEK